MRSMLAWVAGMAVAGALHAQAVWPVEDWASSTPEAQGMDSRALAALVAFGQGAQMDSLLVTRHGRIVAEAHYAPFQAGMPHAVNSATKAVVGALVGIAIARGDLPAADTPVAKLLPGGQWPGKEGVTLQHLLDMNSGLDWKEPLSNEPPETMLQMTRAPDWTRFVLERPVAQPPGSVFNYNSGTWQLLSELLQQRTGLSAEAYAARHLFEPLGIRTWRWRSAPQGRSTGGWGLYLQPRDMARLALLYLREGEWNGRQVVPREWARRVFAASVPMAGAGSPWRYADGWWTWPQGDTYLAAGLHRQLVVVMPRAGIAAAFTGRHHYELEELSTRLRAAVRSDQAIAPDAEGAAELARQVAAAAVEQPGPAAGTSPLAAALDGRTWVLERNPAGAREFVLRFQPSPVLEITWSRAPGSPEPARTTYALGVDGRFAAGGTERDPVLSRARWLDERTLALQQRFVRDGETAQLRLRFEGDQADGEYAHSMGWQVRLRARAQP